MSEGSAAEDLCELCGASGASVPHFPAKGIVRCSECGLIYFRRTGEYRTDLYGRDFFKNGAYLDYESDQEVMEANFAARLRDLQRLLPEGGTLLEIGSAYGFFLKLARVPFRARGMDVAEEAVAQSRLRFGVDAVVQDFLLAPDEPESCDVICLWDTIEHLPHPVRVIEKAARWLKPGGFLALTTGDAGSWVARFRGERWRMIIPPIHLYYFTEDTLTKALGRSGIAVHEVARVGHTRSYRAMVHNVLSRWGERWTPLYRLATLGGRVDFPIRLNLHDLLFMVGRKPEAQARVASTARLSAVP